MSDRSLIGMVVAITGAGSGIGLACARSLSHAGAHLILLDRNPSSLDAAVNELGGHVIDHQCIDITDSLAMDTLFSRLPAVDILINSAGIEGKRGGLEDCNLDDLQNVMNVNLYGALNCIQPFVRQLKQSKRSGSIVNIASTAGMVGSSRLGAYAVSKAAVISMTRSLALSLAPFNIRVNAICPGSIDSPMFDRTIDAKTAAEDRSKMIAMHPLGRLGLLEEVAAAVTFMASPAASYCTGVCLPVDGGRLA